MTSHDLAAALLVDRHRVRPRFLGRDEHRRNLAIDLRPDEPWSTEKGEKHQAADAVLEHQPDCLLLALVIALGRAEHRREAEPRNLALDERGHLREERVAQVASDDADGGRAALEEVARQGVRAVPELVDRALDAPACARRDDRRAPDDVRHGRHRDPGKLGDVAQRRRPHRSLHQLVLPSRRADSATPSSGATSRSSCSMLRTPARV